MPIEKLAKPECSSLCYDRRNICKASTILFSVPLSDCIFCGISPICSLVASSIENDIALAREVAASRPEKPNDWDEIATRLSEHFSTDGKPVELKARGCRERMDRLLSKYKQEDAKSLKRSGAEEDYNELKQLLEDISTFRRDMMVLKDKEKEEKRNQAENGKRKQK
ncbi:Hypothetical predicted protein [Paramuricea clavata]|uniref:Uncharacterized protein n=1 Tax=Paramuricea clavata TaxID=317549 RepID=A0A6S7JE07_PARCT|nr:Hypothetical predicted protein [Paramuricea clavata]